MKTETQTPKAYAALPFLADPERERADARLQEIRQASFGRGRLSEEERTVSRGLALEEIHRRNLAQMTEAREGGNNRRATGGATQEMVEEQQGALAEALAMQGRYRDAAAVHPKKLRARDFEEIADAIDRPDDAECACKPKVAKADGKEIEVDPRNADALVFSERHGKMVVLERCKCGFANAREPRGRIAARLADVQGRAAQARVEQDARTEARQADSVKLRRREGGAK